MTRTQVSRVLVLLALAVAFLSVSSFRLVHADTCSVSQSSSGFSLAAATPGCEPQASAAPTLPNIPNTGGAVATDNATIMLSTISFLLCVALLFRMSKQGARLVTAQ